MPLFYFATVLSGADHCSSYVFQLEERIQWLEKVIRSQCPDFDLSGQTRLGTRLPNLSKRPRTTEHNGYNVDDILEQRTICKDTRPVREQ
jgi:hypothetical protein